MRDNIPSIISLIVAVFFLSVLPMPGHVFDKVLFSSKLYAADHAKTN
jgi:hypothetical protein